MDKKTLKRHAIWKSHVGSKLIFTLTFQSNLKSYEITVAGTAKYKLKVTKQNGDYDVRHCDKKDAITLTCENWINFYKDKMIVEFLQHEQFDMSQLPEYSEKKKNLHSPRFVVCVSKIFLKKKNIIRIVLTDSSKRILSLKKKSSNSDDDVNPSAGLPKLTLRLSQKNGSLVNDSPRSDSSATDSPLTSPNSSSSGWRRNSFKKILEKRRGSSTSLRLSGHVHSDSEENKLSLRSAKFFFVII